MWREGLSLASSSSSSVCVCWCRCSRACVSLLCVHPALHTADHRSYFSVHSTPYLETMVPQESTGCIDLSARLHGLVARSRKTWISCLRLQVLNP